tara:strand:+ start:90 stop:1403 length:1314 start_codon:yes stop_codon:yes gene_type:complete
MSAGTLDLTMEEVENADGTTSTTEEQADRFSDDIQGVVYYFTTGDHTKNADGEYKNLAPEFKVNINAQRDNGSYNIKSNLNIKDNTSSDIPPSPSFEYPFDGVVQIEAGEGKVHRNYHIFSDADTIDGFQIPFPKITNPDVTNISLSFAFFDSLSLRRAFNIDDSDEPKQDKYNDGSDTYVNDRIFSDHTLNFSTYPSNKDLEYTIGGTQSTGPNTAFLEPLGTSIRLNEFNPTPSAASDLAFAYWGEFAVGYDKIEARLICGEVRDAKVIPDQSIGLTRAILDDRKTTKSNEFLGDVAQNSTVDGLSFYKLEKITTVQKGDLVDYSNMEIYTRKYVSSSVTAIDFYIRAPFTRALDTDSYSVFIQSIDGGPNFYSTIDSADGGGIVRVVKNPENCFITSRIFIVQDFDVVNLKTKIANEMSNNGGMKIKFGILIDE